VKVIQQLGHADAAMTLNIVISLPIFDIDPSQSAWPGTTPAAAR
jgi:hypothetical protein